MKTPAIAFYPPLPPGAHLRRPAKELPYPLGRRDCSLFSRGRHAIWQAVRALGLGPGDAVLAPAWHHGAEIEALRRAGPAVVFYEPGEQLEPDEEELDSLVDERTRALFVTHYLGFGQDAARWRDWCDERGLLLIEDAAHACLSRHGDTPLGSHGEAAVWCLFKTFALPDGAALRLAGDPPEAQEHAPLGAAELARSQANWLFQHAPALAALGDRTAANGHFDLAAEIALGRPGTPPSAATRFLLPRVADAEAAARRRANYTLLLDELGDQVPEPFDRLPEGTCPLGLPLQSPAKRTLIRRLAERGIEAVDFWCAPHPLLPADGFELTARRRESTVLVPVQQELRPADLERIADAARARPRRTPDLRVERADSIAALYEEWSDVARRARNVFATPDWAAVWCAHFLRGRPLELVALRDPSSGRLVAVLPLYVLYERPLRVLRTVGHGPGEDLGPVCAPEDRVRVARALPRVLAELDAQAVLADHVSRAAGWSCLAGARVLRTESSPAIHLDAADWDAFTAGLSRRLRKELRRHERLLEAEHAVRYRLAGRGEDEVRADLDTMFALHAARWRNGSSRFSAQREFHRQFADVARTRGWLRLWILEADDRPVAAAYGFRYAGVEFDYQGGRDPDWAGPSAGLVLQGRQIRAALEDGVREYRLCRGDAWYKQRLATDDPGLETLVFPRGHVAAAAAAAGAALPEPLSKIVKRRLAT